MIAIFPAILEYKQIQVLLSIDQNSLPYIQMFPIRAMNWFSLHKHFHYIIFKIIVLFQAMMFHQLIHMKIGDTGIFNISKIVHEIY